MNIKIRKNAKAFTLIELVVTIAIFTIPMLIVGILLASGHRAWQQTYDSLHKQIKTDALATTIMLNSLGRKANRMNYTIYQQNMNRYFEASPDPVKNIAKGSAIELRYWDVDQPNITLLDTSNTGTDYVFVYIDGNKLKVDYGSVDSFGVGAIDGSSKTTPFRTVTLAENLDPLHTEIFSHTMHTPRGQGCFRTNIKLIDPDDNEELMIKTAVMLRNNWP